MKIREEIINTFLYKISSQIMCKKNNCFLNLVCFTFNLYRYDLPVTNNFDLFQMN